MGNVLPYVFRSNSFALREVSSGLLPDMLPNLLCDRLPNLLSDRLRGVLTDMLPGVLNGPLLLTRIHHMPHEQEGVGGALTDAV